MTDMRMFEEQTKIIQALAKQAPGVFLGRCANFVLGGQPHSYSFFVYADDEYREKEGKEYYKGQTLNELKLRDIQRNEYYQGFDRHDYCGLISSWIWICRNVMIRSTMTWL